MLFDTPAKKKISTGRSMAEMIAVLAIMGILSLGGLSGINYIKDKNHANQILKEALSQTAEIKTAYRVKTKTENPLEIQYAREASSEHIKFWAFQDVSRRKVILKAFNISQSVCQKLVAAASNEVFECVGSAKHGSNANKCEDLGECENGTDLVFITDTITTISGTTSTRIDPCVGIDCTGGKTCVAGVCVCPAGLVENKNGVCEDCEEPRISCTVSDSWDSNGCQIWEHLDCGADDCNEATGSCCPSGETYYKQIKDCCLSEQWATQQDVCCKDDETPSKGYCCPIGQEYFEEISGCCLPEQWATTTKKCCTENEMVIEGYCEKICSSYTDCGSGYFCDKSNQTTSCNEPIGVCREAATKTAFSGFEYLTYSGKTTASKNGAMDWWSAQDFCKSLGLKHASAENSCTSNWRSAGISACTGFRSGSTRNNIDYWLTETDSCNAYNVSFNQDIVVRIPKYASKDPGDGTDVYALCENTCPEKRVFKNGKCVCSWTAPENFNDDTCECMEEYEKTQIYNADGTEKWECRKPCKEDNSGLFLLIDSSGSMCNSSSSCEKHQTAMNNALKNLSIILDGNTALYTNEQDECGDSLSIATSLLPYGKHSKEDFEPWFKDNSGHHCQYAWGTDFTAALNKVSSYCQGNEDIVVAWWTDGSIRQEDTVKSIIKKMKSKCNLSLFYMTPNATCPDFVKYADSYSCLNFSDSTISEKINEKLSNLCFSQKEPNYSETEYIFNRIPSLSKKYRGLSKEQCDLGKQNTVFFQETAPKFHTKYRVESSRVTIKNIGFCHACNSTTDISNKKDTTKEECDRCPNRTYENGKCILK